MLVLHVLQGPDAGKRFPLPVNEPQLIGRSTEALTITDRSVSRRHAELTPDDGVWYLRDLDSANGTFVNGRPVLDRTALAPGDRIRCGDTLLVLAPSAANEIAAEGPIAPLPIAAAVEARLPANAPSVADPRFRLLQELASLADLALDRPALLDRALSLVREEFGAERALLVSLGPDGRAVRIDAASGAMSPPPAVGPDPVREALASGVGLLLADAAGETRASADAIRPQTVLCVPVRAPERTIGALWVERPIDQGAFDERHLRLLQAVGVHIALFLRHGELLDAVLAKERLAAMGETVATLSHSIKNILQALRGGADTVELALSRGDLAIAREGWPILARNLDRIHSLVRNMLAYAKERALEPVATDVNELVREVAALLASAAARRRIRIVFELDDGLPPMPLDPDAIHQALLNLVANAIEAAPERTGTIVLATRWREDDAEAEILVRDDGAGIPEALRPRLFEPFLSSKGQRGTGLGLAVSRKLVEQHGGRIQIVESGPAGTAIAIRLPDRGPPEDADRTRGPRPIDESELDIEFGDPELP